MRSLASLLAPVVTVSVASLLGSGCLIDRSPLGAAPSLDAWVPEGVDAALDGGRVVVPDAAGDGGPPCTSTECDDGNPCTDDSCDTTGCTNAPNTEACDDGVLCNGADTCSAGACTRHDGVDPCPAPTSCDAASDTCLGCTRDEECPTAMTGPFGSCTFSAGDVCGEAGTRERTITRYTCDGGACRPAESTEAEACARETDGVSCGATVEGDYGACVYADELCATEGTRRRTVTTFTCAAGSCASMGLEELDTLGCARVTDGLVCGTDELSGWGSCEASTMDACSTSGARSRTRTRFACLGGACGRASSTETEACVRTTDGTSCGPPVCDPFGPCMRTDSMSCSEAGTRSRSCRPSLCMGGTCAAAATRTDTEACSVSPIGGLSCATSMNCSPCLEPGMTRCRSGRAGEQFCSDGIGTCTAGTIGDPTCIETAPVRTSCTCP